MGMNAYHMRELTKQHNTKGSKPLTAQQMAVMTRQHGNDVSGDYEAGGSGDEELLLEDDTTASRRAEGFGFFSWVGGLFSEDIIFSFHGTRIKGKDKHQVRGGVVPLFNGVVLDLTPASMVGEVNGERQSVGPLESGGTPAKLVVSPARRGFITEHDLADFVITAQKNGQADGFSAKITKQITYDLGAGVSLLAQGAAICQEQMVLSAPRLTGVKGDGEIGGAVIDGGGISITPKGGSENTGIESKAQEMLEHGPGEDKPTEGQVSEAKPPESQVLEAEPPESQPSEDKASGDDQLSEDEKGEDNAHIVLGNMAVKIKGKDKSISADVKDKSVSYESDDLKAAVSMGKKTFNISWGKSWTSEEDEDEDEEEDKDEDDEKSNVKKALKEFYKVIQSNGTDIFDKAGFAKDVLIQFFQTGKMPDNKFEDAEGEEESKEVKLAEVPIFPGLTFGASLKPVWNFGVHFDFALAEGSELPDITVTTQNGKVTGISYPKIERMLSLTAEVRGKIGATLKLALEAGLGYILSLSGGLSATGEARGIIDKSENTFGKGKFQIPLTMQGKEIKTGDAALNLQTGIGIFGSVGADLSVGSSLIGWEKELWSYTFKEWNPANLEGELQLKQNKGKGGFFNPRSWEIEKKDFNFELFKKRIEGSERYGLKMPKAPEKAEALTTQSEATGEKLKELHEKLAAMEKNIGESGGQFGTDGNEAYETLMNELSGIEGRLKVLIFSGEDTFRAMEAEVSKYKDSERYQKGRDKVESKIAKHKERYAQMQEWGNGERFKGNEKARNKEAYAYYEKTFQAKEALREKKSAREEAAKRSVATKERLIAYERGMIEKLGKEHDERIKKLEQMIEEIPEEERGKMNPGFLAAYKELGKGELIKKAQRYAGKERIIAYEQGLRDEYKQKQEERYAQLEKKAEELSISDRTVPNRKFVEYYYNDMKERRFFSGKELLHNHQNGKEIVAFEKARLEEKSDSYLERIKTLEKYKADFDKAQSQEEKDDILAKARNDYREAQGGLGKWGQWNINIAKAASREEILEFETARINIDKDGKLSKDYEVVKKAVDIIRTEGEGGFEKQGIKMATINKICHKWLEEKLSGKDTDILEEVIPLKALQDFEQAKMSGIVNREKIASFGIWGEQAKRDALANRLNNNKEYLDRLRRKQYLTELSELTKDMKDSDREAAIQGAKKAYFACYFSGKDGDADKELLKKRLVQGESLFSPELRRNVLERKLEEYGQSHTDRLEKLRKMAGKKESSGVVSDAQMWDEYRDMGAGREFADYYAKKKNGNYSIDDMLRYEQYEARAHSGQNAFKAFLQNTAAKTAAEFVKKEGGEEEAKKKEEQAKGGHYDRYNALKAKLDNNASDKEIAELYIQLGGGEEYVKCLISDGMVFDVVTPQEIFAYEKSWNGKMGEKHMKRLEKLEEMQKSGDGLSDEEFYDQYREMVLEESAYKNLWNKLTGRGPIDFDQSVKAQEVLTPQLILKYEKKSREEKVKQHSERLERLQKEDVTDENALEIYREGVGGEKGFFKENKSLLTWKSTDIGDSVDYQNILDYEKERLAYYENAERELTQPLQKIEETQKQLRTQLDQAMNDLSEVREMWGKYKNPGNQAYKSQEGFSSLTNTATGDNIQEKADQKIIQELSESEEKELSRVQDAEMELMLIEEDALKRE